MIYLGSWSVFSWGDCSLLIYEVFECRSVSLTAFLKSWDVGIPVVVHRKQIRLESIRMRVQCVVSLSGSATWHCRELWCMSKTRLGSRVAVALT